MVAMAEKRKPGRPNVLGQHVQVNVKLRPEEAAMIRKTAKKEGLSVSAYLRKTWKNKIRRL